MENRIDFLQWLSTKLYFISIGFYLTVSVVMVLPFFINKLFEIQPFLASFIAFFIVSFLRAIYESLVIYEAPVKSLSPRKMLMLSTVTSIVILSVSYFLKPKLGYFSIPIAIIASMIVVGKLKAMLWGTTPRPGFFTELTNKLELLSLGRYGFFGLLVGTAYTAYGRYELNFFYTFAVAFFIAMVFEELFNLTKIYEQQMTVRSVAIISIWAIVCAALSAMIVTIMMIHFGYSGQAATITSVVLLKLIQPMGLNWIIRG